MFVGSRGNAVHHPREHACHVLHRLSIAHLDLMRWQRDHVAAQPPHRHLERHAGAQRRLFEDEGEGFAGQQWAGAVALHPERDIQSPRQFIGRKIED